jgi:hypothetical protein
MGRALRLLVVVAVIAYVVGRFEPNFRSVLITINTGICIASQRSRK